MGVEKELFRTQSGKHGRSVRLSILKYKISEVARNRANARILTYSIMAVQTDNKLNYYIWQEFVFQNVFQRRPIVFLKRTIKNLKIFLTISKKIADFMRKNLLKK